MPSAYNLGGYEPARVDRMRTRNRLASLRAEQAEGEMQRQNALRDAVGNLWTEQPVNRLKVSNADALRPGPGGQQSGGRGMPSPDQMQRGTEEVQVGTRRQFNPEAMQEIMGIDPKVGMQILEQRAALSEAERQQEDREVIIMARALDGLDKLPPEQREERYQRLRQSAQERLGIDTLPPQYDPAVANLIRARAYATGNYEPPEAQGGDMPSAVREAMFITGGDEEAARAYLRQQNADTGSDTQRARKIAQTMETYGVDRKTAQGLVDNIIETETDPVTGNTYLVNKIDGTARRLDYNDAGQRSGQQGGDQQAQAQPEGNARMAQEITPDDTLWNSTEGVAGIEGAITEAYQRTAGQIPGLSGGEETQETVGNRQFFRLAQGDLIRSLSINPRFPVAEMQRIQRETDIEPSMWDSEKSLRQRMRRLDSFLTKRLKKERQAANNRDLPVQTRQNAAAAAKDIKNFLDILGVPSQRNDRPQRPGRDAPQQSRGPSPAQIRRMSRERLNSLSQDTSNLSQQQLEAAAERYDQLEGQQ